MLQFGVISDLLHEWKGLYHYSTVGQPESIRHWGKEKHTNLFIHLGANNSFTARALYP